MIIIQLTEYLMGLEEFNSSYENHPLQQESIFHAKFSSLQSAMQPAERD